MRSAKPTCGVSRPNLAVPVPRAHPPTCRRDDGERAVLPGVGSEAQRRNRLHSLEGVQQVPLVIVQSNVSVRQGHKEARRRPYERPDPHPVSQVSQNRAAAVVAVVGSESKSALSPFALCDQSSGTAQMNTEKKTEQDTVPHKGTCGLSRPGRMLFHGTTGIEKHTGWMLFGHEPHVLQATTPHLEQLHKLP